MNRKVIFEYLRTFFLTILLVCLIIFFMLVFMQYQLYREDTAVKKTIKEDTLDYYLIGSLIEKNKFLEIESPENYRINMKLARLYEIKQDLKNAEIEYKKAVMKVPYHRFEPQYRLALLYIKLGRLSEAQDLMDKISEKPDKKLIKYKADIFDKLGESYYNKADYEEASFKYQKAFNYYKIINFKKEQEHLKGNLASSYVYLADQKVKEYEIDDAINYLQLAKSLIDAPIIKYKLALLLAKTDSILACQYFDEVFKQEPKIINYESYRDFLSSLALKYELVGNQPKANLYRYRIKKLKEYYNSKVLSVDDLKVDYIDGNILANNLIKKYVIHLQIQLTNNSSYNINSLYLDIVFKNKNNVIDTYSEKIIDTKNVLKTHAQGSVINIKTASHKIDNDKPLPTDIDVQIYATKAEDTYKILLAEFKIKAKEKKAKSFKIKAFPLKFALPQF